MRLNKYLTEENLYGNDDLFADIKKKCKPYLSLLKGKEPVYRGIHDPHDSKDTTTGLRYGIKKVHKNRTSKGTRKEDFKLVNKWLSGNGHVRRDQAVSVTTSEMSAAFFGNNSWMFPIGKFDYSWVKSPDFNHTNKNVGYYTTTWDAEDENSASIWEFLVAYYNGTLDSRTKQADLAHFITTNKGFVEAYKKGYEIWISCKEYYYVLTFLTCGNGYYYKWKELSYMI